MPSKETEQKYDCLFHQLPKTQQQACSTNGPTVRFDIKRIKLASAKGTKPINFISKHSNERVMLSVPTRWQLIGRQTVKRFSKRLLAHDDDDEAAMDVI